jgi:hypothetical protein
MIKELNTVMIPLKNVVLLMISVAGIIFATGMFYNESSNHDKKLLILDQRLDKKIKIQSKNSDNIHIIDKKSEVNKTEIKNIKKQLDLHKEMIIELLTKN